MTATSESNGASPSGRHAADPTMGQLVADASESLSTLIRSEVELAKLELRASVKNAGVGIGFFGAAAVVLVFSLTFGFIALAEGLHAAGLWRWLAYLVVFAGQVCAVGLFAFLGVKKVKRVRAPERTIATSKDTVAYLKANTKRG
ncbi:MAG TPA: phage holin family protein [Jatrophihabitantaceae bacterium]|nr:phage holin family protein [Jatrophihabitantaceae bacterium]